MGFWDWLTGDDDPEPVNYAQTSVADIPGYIKEPSERLMAASEGLAGQAYDPYGGDRLAGLQPDMLQAMQDTRDQAGIGALRGTEAYNMGMGSGRDIAQADIARYTNPYLTDVAGQTERELRRAAEQQGIASSAQVQKAGAFGGSRHGIIDAERGRNLEQNVGDVYAKTYAQGHESALEQFNKQRDFERQGALTGAQVASQGQNMGFQDISQRMGIGSLQQGQGQATTSLMATLRKSNSILMSRLTLCAACLVALLIALLLQLPVPSPALQLPASSNRPLVSASQVSVPRLIGKERLTQSSQDDPIKPR